MQPWNTFRTGAHVPFMADASVAYFLAVKEQQTGLPRRPDWWNQWIDKPNLPTIKLLDGPLWEIAYAQEVLRVTAQHVQTTGMLTPHLRASRTCSASSAEGGRGHRSADLVHHPLPGQDQDHP
jgi:hypothetical protein